MTATITGHTTETGNGNGATFNVDPANNMVGTAIATGNWIVMVISSAAGTGVRTPTISGWTQLQAFGQVGSGTTSFGAWGKLRKSNETVYTFSQSGGTDGTVYRLIWGSGGQDPSNWIVGTFTNRAANATNTTTVAPAITTVIPNTLALQISEERTLAAETDNQVTCDNFTKQWFENDVDHSIFVSSKNMATVGSTGTVTTTYPNSHSENGIAGIVGIQPVEIPFTWGGAM